jgi:Domain of unknown function (DUF1772)
MISFVFLPSLRQVTVPLDRISVWSKQYDLASKIMIRFAGIAFASFGIAAYYAPTRYLQKSMIASALLSISVMPFTLKFIFPTNNALKAIEKDGDGEKALSEGDKLLEKWGKLGLVRWSIMAAATLIGMKELSGWYTL